MTLGGGGRGGNGSPKRNSGNVVSVPLPSISRGGKSSRFSGLKKKKEFNMVKTSEY